MDDLDTRASYKQLAASRPASSASYNAICPLELQPAPEHAGGAVCTQASIPQDPTGADGPMLLWIHPSIGRHCSVQAAAAAEWGENGPFVRL